MSLYGSAGPDPSEQGPHGTPGSPGQRRSVRLCAKERGKRTSEFAALLSSKSVWVTVAVEAQKGGNPPQRGSLARGLRSGAFGQVPSVINFPLRVWANGVFGLGPSTRALQPEIRNQNPETNPHEVGGFRPLYDRTLRNSTQVANNS